MNLYNYSDAILPILHSTGTIYYCLNVEFTQQFVDITQHPMSLQHYCKETCGHFNTVPHANALTSML